MNEKEIEWIIPANNNWFTWSQLATAFHAEYVSEAISTKLFELMWHQLCLYMLLSDATTSGETEVLHNVNARKINDHVVQQVFDKNGCLQVL